MSDYAAALPVVDFVASAKTTLPRRAPMTSSRGFCVTQLLSRAECEGIVARVRDEAGMMKSVDWEYVASYRRCDRAVFSSPSLAAVLEERLRPLLEVGDLDGIKPFGIGAEGTWVLASPFINNVFRVSAYQEVREKSGRSDANLCCVFFVFLFSFFYPCLREADLQSILTMALFFPTICDLSKL